MEMREEQLECGCVLQSLERQLESERELKRNDEGQALQLVEAINRQVEQQQQRCQKHTSVNSNQLTSSRASDVTVSVVFAGMKRRS